MTEKKYSSFKMGEHGFSVSMKMFEENRARLINRVTCLPNTRQSVILLQGGKTINHYSTDMEYLFRQESFFYWLFGVTEPGYYGAINLANNSSALFIPRLPEDYAIWMGKLPTTNDVKDKYNVSEVFYVDQIREYLEELSPSTILTLSGVNSDSNLECQEACFEGISSFTIDNTTLYPEICECRVIKSQKEIEIMKYVCKISSEAHILIMQKIRPNMYEFQAESDFLHYCYYIGGCRHMAYTSICGAGCNGAILHYGHAAAPNNKQIKDNELCLFDMGASYCGYSADITCSFPVNGKFSDRQKLIYNAVLHANKAVLKTMKPGISWVDLHLLALRTLLSELQAIGIVLGDVNEMLKRGLGAIFMPHGLGHLLGCDVHDVGGYTKYTPERPKDPNLQCLRTARILEAGMIITVEPGCYFINELIDKALSDPELKEFMNAEVVNQYRGFGGVRIEDDILVTQTGMENLTCVPRSVEAIEELMQKATIPIPSFPSRVHWKI